MVNFNARPLPRSSNNDSVCGLDPIEDLFNETGADFGVGVGSVEDVNNEHHNEGMFILYFCIYFFEFICC